VFEELGKELAAAGWVCGEDRLELELAAHQLFGLGKTNRGAADSTSASMAACSEAAWVSRSRSVSLTVGAGAPSAMNRTSAATLWRVRARRARFSSSSAF